jgi:hypothetical protein
MFRKRTDANEGTTDSRAEPVAQRRWYGPTRALTTLLGAAGAFVLLWLSTQVGDDSNGAYWAEYGLIAAAGLVMAFSQIAGGWTKWGVPRVSPHVFVVAFLPVLIVGGWILLAHQPDSGLWRGHIRDWSGSLGVRGLVNDFRELVPAVAFLIGLTFGLSFDTSGPRLRVVRDVDRKAAEPAPAPPLEKRAADEPTTAERDVAIRDGDRQVVRTGGTAAPHDEDVQ